MVKFIDNHGSGDAGPAGPDGIIEYVRAHPIHTSEIKPHQSYHTHHPHTHTLATHRYDELDWAFRRLRRARAGAPYEARGRLAVGKL